jgi:hypothetical protein
MAVVGELESGGGFGAESKHFEVWKFSGFSKKSGNVEGGWSVFDKGEAVQHW